MYSISHMGGGLLLQRVFNIKQVSSQYVKGERMLVTVLMMYNVANSRSLATVAHLILNLNGNS